VSLTLGFRPLRFEFTALDRVRFPESKAANILRGALGLTLRRSVCPPDCAEPATCRLDCPYTRLFEPHATGGPSGLAAPPRPFVLRAAHLDGAEIPAGASFYFDLNYFAADLTFRHLGAALRGLGKDGLGPGRPRVRLDHLIEHPPVTLSLEPGPPCHRLRIDFLTATEIKGLADPGRPDFQPIAARVRDRIATLSSLYGGAPLALDFKAFGELARQVVLADHHLSPVRSERTSTRTGQTHPLGGFIGWAVYEGPLTGFVPFFEAAQYTGAGRQTVWGKGAIRVTRLDP